MMDRRRLLALAGASATAPLLPRAAHSQSAWPNRPVRLIVPFAPGGGTDGVARIIAARLSEIWGQQMVIENKGGAGSNIGIEHVARSEPDGYTVLIASLPLAINRYIYSSVSYDPVANFAPVTLICLYPNLMIVPNSSPVKSVTEFIDYAKKNKGKITYASSGTGTSTHLAGELFKRMAGIEMTHVPYRGVAPALNDVIPGRIDVMFNTIGGTLQQARAGQVRGLAVTSAQRFTTAAEYPTVAESGLPGFNVSAWYSLFVPAKTPPAVVNKMNADAVAVLAEPAVKQKLEGLGVAIVASTPAELGRHLKSESDLWEPVIKAAGIKDS
jgi:tripartite-type tricarboxylate transporter receptor subunit TctC